MKVQMVIMHVQSGTKWGSEQSDISDVELEEMKTAMKENISSLTYIDVDGDILPGDFIRNHCIIQFKVKD